MSKLRGFGDVLVAALRIMKRPVMFMPAAIMFAVCQALAMSYMSVVSGITQTASPDALRQWGSQQGALVALGALAIALMAPAGVSGLASLAQASVERDAGDWRDFWGGLGTYYGKALGAYLLFAVMIAFCGKGLFRLAAEFVGAYFFVPWIAAAAFDGTGIIDSISAGAKFAWKNPDLLVPGYLMHQIGKFLVQAVVTRSVFTVDAVARSVTVGQSWFLGATVGGAAHGCLYMLFMLVCFIIYRMRRIAPAAVEVPEGAEAIEAESPPVPPLDPHEGAE